ncbi:MAG: S41 family peptidase [Bryobacterales bacterium]|nr:S41 family peptidase [Bryobacterales bacterium]
MIHAFLAFFLFQANANDLKDTIRTFTQAWALVEQNAATATDANSAIYEGALPSLLRTLDPHSVFFSPAQFEQLKEMQKSTSKGFGTIVSVLPGRVIVLQAMEGAPGARAGIAAGDEIIAINNYRLDMLNMEQLIGLLGETRRQQAQLWVRRAGSARPLQFTLTPEELASPSVDRAFLLKPGFGFVRITSFEGETGKQVKTAIEKLGGTSLQGLVLDLRNNPGGLLPSAMETAALFLNPGQMIVSVRGRARQLEETRVPNDTSPYRFPVAVLINEKTASASEIVAAALQDHKRGVILGAASFGKGLVQSVYPLSEGTGMALTTAFYFTPNGRSVQRPLKDGQLSHYTNLGTDAGLRPDREVYPETMTRLRAYLDSTGILTNYATERLAKSLKVDATFDISNQLLDELQLFLSERNVRPSLAEWSADREWIRSRLLQEILNQALGVEKGDEVELRRDPAVLQALTAVTQP